jgi:Uma2 family endonuclease
MISSLKETILVSTEYKKIEIFTRSDNNKWILSESDNSGIIKLNSIEYELKLEDVYEKVEID